MVQQVSLMSTIAASQYNLTQLTLMSLTGMRPLDLSTHTVTLKPKFPFKPEVVAGKVNQIEQYRIRMNRVWDAPLLEEIEKLDEGEIKGQSIFETGENAIKNLQDIWTLQVSEIPLAGKRTTSSQTIYEITVCDTDDILGYLDELGYMPETEFWTKGSRFFYNDVIIEVFKIFQGKPKSPQAENDEFAMETDETGETELEELDSAKKFFVKACINVAKITDVDNLTKASKQLETLKTELSGLFELEMPNRVAMDSRLNSRIVSAGQQPRSRP
ncbi:unnamed protein product [Kuraishia capsulata CBS 1993]|uniref:Mediator of RNA polymerase II transcription subunit 18 n=1 Tax=Kuraishia capsulata CBS 1993 TaxID=1382522 RepID=W6MI03_9ASCO|nr:uncharacterized protein KUCA_T00001448001 [Kuraishia capsulata CBS 1993]CDK25478.1 unnamed protein product [Kuraishia capsulata CBS 1993]